MEYLVVGEIEIDGDKIKHYSNIRLMQKMNAHHKFYIRINHDVLEDSGSFSLEKAKTKIGKTALIRLHQSDLSLQLAYEFSGIICEVRMEQSGNSNADLVLIGYSPTILLENGQHLNSFVNRDLKQIVLEVTKPLGQVNCNVNINNQYKKKLNYISQYRESGFHFLNRLSGDFSEFLYYDGKELNFGKPALIKNIDVTYGEDINTMELSLHARPMKFSNYSYISKDNKVEELEAPPTVNGLGQYGNFLLHQSDEIFPDAFNLPVRQRIETRSDLENFGKKQKAAMAVNLEVLTGTGYNPNVSIGSVINVKASKLQGQSFKKEDFGKYLVTSIEHYITENSKYYNVFEAVPSEVEVLPVNNTSRPVAEPQIAIVKDNDDPDKSGRVRVQMLWQKGNHVTDWIRVMTPDAGSGKGNAKNRGFVAIPEKGDEVLVAFRYNDPDRPFVLGSLFHGKSGGGGGNNNKVKSLTALSGSTVTLDGDAISIIDAGGNKMFFSGDGKIEIESAESIKLACGGSSLELKKDGTITLECMKEIIMHAKEKIGLITDAGNISLQSSAADVLLTAKGNVRSTAETGDISLDALAADVVANSGAGIKLTGQSEFTAKAPTAKASLSGLTLSLEGIVLSELKAAIVKIN